MQNKKGLYKKNVIQKSPFLLTLKIYEIKNNICKLTNL